jgi:hypothetical protein
MELQAEHTAALSQPRVPQQEDGEVTTKPGATYYRPHYRRLVPISIMLHRSAAVGSLLGDWFPNRMDLQIVSGTCRLSRRESNRQASGALR